MLQSIAAYVWLTPNKVLMLRMQETTQRLRSYLPQCRVPYYSVLDQTWNPTASSVGGNTTLKAIKRTVPIICGCSQAPSLQRYHDNGCV